MLSSLWAVGGEQGVCPEEHSTDLKRDGSLTFRICPFCLSVPGRLLLIQSSDRAMRANFRQCQEIFLVCGRETEASDCIPDSNIGCVSDLQEGFGLCELHS